MRKQLRFLCPTIFTGLAVMLAVLLFNTPKVHAEPYNPNYLISDSIFDNTTVMSTASIQSFLVSEGSGLANYSDVINCNPTTPTAPDPYSASYYNNCGASVSAAQIIYEASQAYGISPRVILATLEKEQSLVTTPDPTQSQINCAMGYNSCGGYVGFFNQVDNGTWQLRTYIQLMNGQGWWGHSPSQYVCANGSSLYSTGLYPGRTVTFADPGGTAETITLADASTAALYCYTPYVGPYSLTGYSGSYNFVVYFEEWFGTVYGPCTTTSNLSDPSGASVVPDQLSGTQPDNLALTIANNTGSTCAEVHIWNSSFNSLINNYATNLPVFNPADGQMISADLNGSGQNKLIYVNYTNTASGNIEIHVWDPNYQTFDNDYVTDLPSAPPSQGQVIAGDFYGNGEDELAYVKYQDTGSGNIEIHVWNSNFTGFLNDYVTNVAENPPTTGQVIAANLNGGGANSFIYVIYQDTGSGKLELHIWKPGFQSFMNDYVTNVSENPPNIGQVLGANINTNGKAYLIYALLDGSGSGNVEIHVWNPGYQSFANDFVTNVGEFSN
ncbi:MAG TPA: hypothetical protein VMR34_00580 [Candidatus Saccharimonadales bacterium]|nr:hypothetical protein [Candidatus Saccharimonadales bacterium]